MSLINDALKRAAQTPPPPLSTTDVAENLRPVEDQEASAWSLLWFPILVVVMIVGLGGWFLVKGWEGNRHASEDSSAMPVAARTPPASPAPTVATTPPVQPAPSAIPASQASNSIPAGTTATNATEAPPVTEGVATPVAPPKPAFPSLRLQGIFYRPSNPSVVINGKILYRGDQIEKVKVLKIQRSGVTLQWEAEIKELTLE